MKTKKCPHCGEEVLAVAKKCKHCHNWVESVPVEPPKQQEQSESDAPKDHNFNQDINSVAISEATKEKEKSRLSAKYQFLLGVGIGVVCTLLIGWLFFSVKPKQEQLYLLDGMQPNRDDSYYVGVATNDFYDRLAIGKGWCGDLQIVIYKTDSPSGKYESIISGSQLEGNVFNVYPSSKHSSVVYFNGTKDENFESFYGKVDVNTHAYDEFNGTIFGMITRGSYKDCYLVQHKDMLYIFPQSPVGEPSDPTITFAPQDYFGDIDMWNPDVQTQIIRWLEEQ